METAKSTFTENPFKSCDKCIHVGVCGAFRMFGSGLIQIKGTYDFINKPVPQVLATMCSEYKTNVPTPN